MLSVVMETQLSFCQNLLIGDILHLNMIGLAPASSRLIHQKLVKQ